MKALCTPITLPTSVAVSSLGQVVYGREPGSYSLEMESEAYHADRRYVSSSGCKMLLRSPEHYLAYRNGPRQESTPSQRLGTALHCAVLEPAHFASTYVPYAGQRRGGAWAEFHTRHRGMEILTDAEWQAVTGMRDAILDFQQFPIGGFVAGGTSEKSIFFVDRETGVPCKIRCDSVNPHLILDLKTTDDARADPFTKQILKLQYQVQAAMYVEGCRHFYGRALPFYFVVVETKPPYGVMVHKAGDSILEIGDRLWRKSLDTYRQCLDSGDWPSYPDAVNVLELPAWTGWGT